MKKLMSASYENAYRGDGFSQLSMRVEVQDMGGHYALRVMANLHICFNDRERSTSSDSGLFEFVEYTPQAASEYADALTYAIDEVRRLCKLANYNDRDASVIVRDVVERFNRYAGQFVPQAVCL